MLRFPDGPHLDVARAHREAGGRGHGRRVAAGVACGVVTALCALLPGGASAAWGPGVEATLPANAGATPFVSLRSVSCPSSGNCTAVGTYDDSSNASQGLLLTETAGVWAPGVEATLPAGAGSDPSVTLTAVSCTSAGNCTAVGNYIDSSNSFEGLLLTETAGVWAPGVEASLPADVGVTANVLLDSVSCVSAGNCTAVGSYSDSSFNSQGLLLTETAGVWATGLEAALPANAMTGGDLFSVSCASAGNCTAVGDYTDSSDNSEGLLLTETAGVWATGVEASLPADGATTNQLAAAVSVSCPSAGNCSAVGRYRDSSLVTHGLLLTETGGVWASPVEATAPANAFAPPLPDPVSVSCASPGSCAAVGTYYNGAGGLDGLLLSQTAGAWATGVETSLPADAAANPVVLVPSVSCASPGNCAAVGKYQTGPTAQGLLLNEVAGVWGGGAKAVLPANTSAYPSVLLSSVSCAPGGTCAAVGSYLDSTVNDQGLLLSETAVPTADFSDLIDDSVGVGPGTSLVDTAKTAQAQAQSGATALACATLATYVKEVKAQTGKSISRAVAPDLRGDAGEVEATLGC